MSNPAVRIHASSAANIGAVPKLRVVVVDDVLIGAVAVADVLQRQAWVEEASATTSIPAAARDASDRSATLVLMNAAVVRAALALCTFAQALNCVCFGVD